MAGRRAHVLSVPPVLTNLRASGSERPGDSQDHHLLPLAQLIQLHGSARRVLKQRNRRNASGRGGCIQSHHQDTGLDQFKDRSLAPPPDECKTTAARLGHKRVTGHAVDRSAHRKCCSAVTRHRYSQEAIRRANVDSIRRTAQAAIGRYTSRVWGRAGEAVGSRPIPSAQARDANCMPNIGNLGVCQCPNSVTSDSRIALCTAGRSVARRVRR